MRDINVQKVSNYTDCYKKRKQRTSESTAEQATEAPWCFESNANVTSEKQS